MTIMNSAIYTGMVRHCRTKPKSHSFQYKVFMMYLDLDEVDKVLSLSYLWSKSRLCLAQFKRSDYFGNSNENLKLAVKEKVESELNIDLNGKICMLTNLRYFGYVINPITIYYCFDGKSNLRALLLEVTNTPWGERQQYVVECKSYTGFCTQKFKKLMHVSPFNPMNMTYGWQSNLPGNQVNVQMKNWLGDECVFEAELELERQSITGRSLNYVILQYPFMTVKVVFSIYWEALRLWLKKVPFFVNPKKIKNI